MMPRTWSGQRRGEHLFLGIGADVDPGRKATWCALAVRAWQMMEIKVSIRGNVCKMILVFQLEELLRNRLSVDCVGEP